MIFGIIFGLGAATSQSFSYLSSRSYFSRHGGSFELLVVSHLLMGVFSLIILPFLPNSDLPPFSAYALPLFACAFSYYFGQFSFFMTIRHSEPSKIAPLLGLKILTVAILGILFFKDSLSPVQWVAAIICLGGAMLSNWTGEALPLKGVGWLMATCIGYSLSDLYIRELIDALGRDKLMIHSIVATVYVYLVCGLTALIVIFFLPRKSWGKLKPAMPFALLWYTAMILLFICFGLIGPVYGNIVQSSRGIISVMLGALIAHLGHVHLESKVSSGMLQRRVMAAILIMAAIIMFSLG